MMRRVLPLLLLAAPAPALAENFDLDCSKLPNADGSKTGPPRAHYQIDLAAGKWCADECRSSTPIVRQEGTVIILEDGPNTVNTQIYHAFDGTTGELRKEYGFGGTYAQHWRYACKVEPFGGLTPYLARGAFPRTNLILKLQTAGFLKDKNGKAVEGDVGFRIAVDAQSNALDCAVTQTSGTPELDRHTCAVLMLDPSFRPATDRHGNPIAGTYETSVHWRMP